jgi:hypothetical protein
MHEVGDIVANISMFRKTAMVLLRKSESDSWVGVVITGGMGLWELHEPTIRPVSKRKDDSLERYIQDSCPNFEEIESDLDAIEKWIFVNKWGTS